MVCLNTNEGKELQVSFTHCVEIPKAHCFIATAKEKETERTKVYLIFNQDNRIYTRNGLKGIWEEIKNDAQHNYQIRHSLYEAINSKHIPHFTTNNTTGLFN